MIIVVPVGNNVARGALASEVALVSNIQRVFEMYEPHPLIIGGQQIANVLPVRQNQQFRVPVSLPFEARDGSR